MALPKSSLPKRLSRRVPLRKARAPAAKPASPSAYEPVEGTQLERLLFAAAYLRASRSLAD